jgi:hypothetical protein
VYLWHQHHLHRGHQRPPDTLEENHVFVKFTPYDICSEHPLPFQTVEFINIEGKIHFRNSNLPQVVGACVVASFTEKANHPNKSALLPTILIDKMSFRICFCLVQPAVMLPGPTIMCCSK